jgi:hypothetical protein
MRSLIRVPLVGVAGGVAPTERRIITPVSRVTPTCLKHVDKGDL